MRFRQRRSIRIRRCGRLVPQYGILQWHSWLQVAHMKAYVLAGRHPRMPGKYLAPQALAPTPWLASAFLGKVSSGLVSVGLNLTERR